MKKLSQEVASKRRALGRMYRALSLAGRSQYRALIASLARKSRKETV